MFNWLMKFFTKKKPVLDPELYGGAGGRVPYPPHEVIMERLLQQGLSPTGRKLEDPGWKAEYRAGLFDTHPTPRKPAGPANQRLRSAGYVGLRPLPGPIPPPPPAPPLPTVYFYGQPIESSLERPSAWPPLDPIEPRSSD